MTKVSGEVKISRRALVAGLIFAPFVSQRALADEFPSRPIKLIVPFGAGSVADIVGRKTSDKAGRFSKRPSSWRTGLARGAR